MLTSLSKAAATRASVSLLLILCILIQQADVDRKVVMEKNSSNVLL